MKISHILKIKSNEQVGLDVYKMVFKRVEGTLLPGQFINISTNNQQLLLKRPISIHEVMEETFSIVYRVSGEGTKCLMKMQAGDEVEALVPLGNGFPLKKNRKAVLVGGGIGIPPLLELAKQLILMQTEVTFVLGFREASDMFLIEEFRKLGNVWIATQSGEVGMKGTVMDVLDSIEFDLLYGCGPTGMLKALDFKYNGCIEGYLSFEERMACGIGACFGCVCQSNDASKGYVRVCYDGPVFPLGEVKYG